MSLMLHYSFIVMGSGLIFVGKRAKTKMPYLQKPRFYAASRLCHYYTVWALGTNANPMPIYIGEVIAFVFFLDRQLF